MSRRWRADLEALFVEAGNTITRGAGGRVEAGHEPKHGSTSGSCVLLDLDDGRWYCRSCKSGGDAVTLVRDFRSCSYEEAVAYLVDRFGPPKDDRESDPAAWDDPMPLFGPAPPSFPTDALPPVYRDFVRAEAVATQTPPDLAGSLAIATVSAAGAGVIEVQPRPGWREPVNTYHAVAMPPAARKSAVFADMTAPVYAFERALIDEYGPVVAQARARRKVLEKRLAGAQDKASKAEGAERAELMGDVDDLARELAETPEPVMPRLIVDDVTPERLAGLLAEQHGRMAAFSPEADLLDVLGGRYDRNGAPNLGVFLKGHSGDELRVDRQGRAADIVRRPALTVAVCCQPEVIVGLAAKPGFRGRGALARILYAIPPSTVGRRQTKPPPVPATVRERFHADITRLLALRSYDPDHPPPDPRVVMFDRQADALLERFEAALEPRLARHADLHVIGDWAGKLAGAVVRDAGVLHHAGGDPTAPIGADTVERAIALGEYWLAHAQHAFGLMALDPTVEQASRVLEWLHDTNALVVSGREIHTAFRRTFHRRADLARPIEVLVERGWLRPTQDDRDGAGRRSELFEVNTRRAACADSVDSVYVADVADGEEATSQDPAQADSVDSVYASGADDGPDPAARAYADAREPTRQPTDRTHNPQNSGTAAPPTAPAGAGPVGGAAVEVVTDDAALLAVLPALLAEPALGLDVETAVSDESVPGVEREKTSLDPRLGRLSLVQLAGRDRVIVVDALACDPRLLAPVLERCPRLVGHNLRFDLAFLEAAGLSVPDGDRLFDTMLAARVAEAGDADFRKKGQFTLRSVAERYTGVHLDKDAQRSDWSRRPLTDDQLRYAAEDARVLLPLAGALDRALALGRLEATAALEMRTLPAVLWLTGTGAPFDRPAWEALAHAAEAERAGLELALTAEARTADLPHAGGVKWSSPGQVAAVLRRRGHVVEQTDEVTLQRLAATEPLAALLLRYREANKRATAYGSDYLKAVHPVTGRIHADYLQLGTESGRMSCRGPNLQQVPRGPDYRACFRPPAGRVLVKADYSQIELRVAAEIAGDERLVEAYGLGDDVHALTAATVLGVAEDAVTKAHRQAAKAVNFGLLYGMGAPTLCQHARTKYGVELTEEEAMRIRGQFFRTYRGLRRWHGARPRGVTDTRTMLGRRRLGVSAFTQKCNTPVQGTGADGLKEALALLWETRDRCPGAAPVMVVHDEIVVECDAPQADAAREWLVDCMTRGMQRFLTRVPVTVEATVARDWAGTPVADEEDRDVA